MARTKEFDPDAALEQAMELFWEQGYEATSARELADHLGIGPSSLYSTFGSKHELYLRALDHYRRQGDETVERLLQNETSARAVLRHLFEDALDTATQDNRGCFMANATAERAACDDAVRERACSSLRDMQDLFTQIVRLGQEQGEFDSDRDPVALGRFLAVVQYGVRVTARTDPSDDELRDAVKVALDALE
jgi:TetR/AcrR family transcriptional repressor of nem operon